MDSTQPGRDSQQNREARPVSEAAKDENPFVPIKRTRTFEDVSGYLKKLILDGTLKPGDKLPPEAELARRFNVGRQTVREALRILELSGFLSIRKGSRGGSVITEKGMAFTTTSLIDAIHLNRITIDEMTTARMEIEKIVLYYAVNNADETDINKLKTNIEAAKRKLTRGERPVEENINFHLLLAHASKNHLFVIMLEAITSVLSQFLAKFNPTSQQSKNVIKIHEAILTSITNRDRDKAIHSMSQHLKEVGDWISNKK